MQVFLPPDTFMSFDTFSSINKSFVLDDGMRDRTPIYNQNVASQKLPLQNFADEMHAQVHKY